MNSPNATQAVRESEIPLKFHAAKLPNYQEQNTNTLDKTDIFQKENLIDYFFRGDYINDSTKII